MASSSALTIAFDSHLRPKQIILLCADHDRSLIVV
jgi:hypothetical protein